MVKYNETTYGFDYGSASVTRVASDAKKGWVVVAVASPKNNIQVYVTKNGKTRVYKDGNELREGNHG